MYIVGKTCIDLIAYCHTWYIASYIHTKTGQLRTAFGCQNLDLDHFWQPKLVHPQDHFWLPKFASGPVLADKSGPGGDWFWPGPLFAWQVPPDTYRQISMVTLFIVQNCDMIYTFNNSHDAGYILIAIKGSEVSSKEAFTNDHVNGSVVPSWVRQAFVEGWSGASQTENSWIYEWKGELASNHLHSLAIRWWMLLADHAGQSLVEDRWLPLTEKCPPYDFQRRRSAVWFWWLKVRRLAQHSRHNVEVRNPHGRSALWHGSICMCLELYTEVRLLRYGKLARVIDMYTQLLCLYPRCVWLCKYIWERFSINFIIHHYFLLTSSLRVPKGVRFWWFT